MSKVNNYFLTTTILCWVLISERIFENFLKIVNVVKNGLLLSTKWARKLELHCSSNVLPFWAERYVTSESGIAPTNQYVSALKGRPCLRV